MTTQRIIEAIEATGTIDPGTRQAIEVAVPELIRAGFMHELPLARTADTPKAFRAAQVRLGLTNADTAALLGCSDALVEKMRAGNTTIRPLAAFTMACLPRRVALARIAQVQADDSGEQAAD